MNQRLKCMKYAHESKYDYENFLEQGYGVLPFLCVWKLGFDWKSSLDASGMNWDGFEALKHTQTMFSVLKNLGEKCKVYGVLGRSFQVLCIRFTLCLCMGTF